MPSTLTNRGRFQRLAAWGIGACAIGCGFLVLTGCPGLIPQISIDVSCPETLRIGESGEVRANEVDPGAIPTYLWQVNPPNGGVFANPASANTTFQPRVEGEVIVRLTASDSIFQVIDTCTILVEGSLPLVVSLEADDADVFLDETVTLTCESIGTDEAESVSIRQIAGRLVDLLVVDEQTVTLTPDRVGDYTFRCTGMLGEDTSEPSDITVRVRAMPVQNMNTNTNGNMNSNANTNDNMDFIPIPNDNDAENENDNG
jgi:hypothetical protein